MKKIISLTFLVASSLLFFSFFYPSEGVTASIWIPQIGVENQEIIQSDPDWFDEAWHYRRPVTISSTDSLGWYQVLIPLNGVNFPSFSLTNTDGSDVRFTHSDGTTLLDYWIESWDVAGQKAYIWVRVPGLVDGNTVIYIYYNNPEADPVSNGRTTFDRFDNDWEQFSAMGLGRDQEFGNNQAADSIESPFTWSVIRGTPQVSPGGILSLGEGTGINSLSTHQYQAVGFRANFGLGAGHEWIGFINGSTGQRAMIGDLPLDVDDLYLINFFSATNNTILDGPSDWHNAYHVYEIRWKAGWSQGDVDHGLSTASSIAQVPMASLPITLYSYDGSDTTLMVDWIYVRQFHDPEPTFEIGDEQGLVELGIAMTDTPDPLPVGASLTYQLSILNTGSINAPGVVVTDVLPGNVQIGEVSASQGSCIPGGTVNCDLGTLLSNSTASITVIVTPTVNGVITATATVGSPGFELNLSDNTAVETTLIDSQPPVVNWEEPVSTGEIYITYNDQVQLEASATDNDQVATVEFLYWDHNSEVWKFIGSDNIYAYQVAFDTSPLEPNQAYLTIVRGIDRAGNKSDPYNPLQIIYIERRLLAFLPLMIK